MEPSGGRQPGRAFAGPAFLGVGKGAGFVNRQIVCGFKAPRSRGTKTPNRIKQNKINTQTMRGRENIGLKRF